jgi:aminopeptidase N
LTGRAYSDNAYGKPALGYLALKDMLGDATFKTALHGFMERWHGKHPIPWDFFNSVNNLTGQNLDWFWKSWYFSPGYIDLAIRDVARSGNGYAVTIDNIGGMPAPADLEAHFTDGSDGVFHQTSAMWRANQRQATVVIPTSKSLQSLSLNGGIWLDADSTNNRWTQVGRN